MKKELPIGVQIFILIAFVWLAMRFIAPVFFTMSLPMLGETDFEKIDLEAPRYNYAFAFATMLSLFLFAVLVYGRMVKQNVKSIIGPSRFTWKTAGIVFFVLIAAWFVADGLYLINHEIILQFPDLGYLDKEAEANAAYGRWFSGDRPAFLPLSLFVFAALPAFIEELIFRGLLLTKLKATSGNPHFAVIVSGLLFAAFHTQAWNLLPIFGMGVILGYVYVYTKDIRYSMGMHFMYNAVQITLMYFAPEMVM